MRKRLTDAVPGARSAADTAVYVTESAPGLHRHRRLMDPAALWHTVRRSLLPLALAAVAIGGGLLASSASADTKSDAPAAIKKALESRYPGTHVLDIKPSAMPGVFEVYLGNELVYSDASGDYLLGGPMVDTQTHQNITEARLNDYGRVDFNTLPLDRAIKVVKGNGSRQFAVFSDPDCPFCQELEKTLLSVTDFTMYVFLFPIPTLHPQATAKAHAIWCAPDRAQAWALWMQTKKLPGGDAKTCAGDPVAELAKLGEKLHVNSTPTLFFASGKRVAGALQLDELQKMLGAPHK